MKPRAEVTKSAPAASAQPTSDGVISFPDAIRRSKPVADTGDTSASKPAAPAPDPAPDPGTEDPAEPVRTPGAIAAGSFLLNKAFAGVDLSTLQYK